MKAFFPPRFQKMTTNTNLEFFLKNGKTVLTDDRFKIANWWEALEEANVIQSRAMYDELIVRMRNTYFINEQERLKKEPKELMTTATVMDGEYPPMTNEVQATFVKMIQDAAKENIVTHFFMDYTYAQMGAIVDEVRELEYVDKSTRKTFPDEDTTARTALWRIYMKKDEAKITAWISNSMTNRATAVRMLVETQKLKGEDVNPIINLLLNEQHARSLIQDGGSQLAVKIDKHPAFDALVPLRVLMYDALLARLKGTPLTAYPKDVNAELLQELVQARCGYTEKLKSMIANFSLNRDKLLMEAQTLYQGMADNQPALGANMLNIPNEKLCEYLTAYAEYHSNSVQSKLEECIKLGDKKPAWAADLRDLLKDMRNLNAVTPSRQAALHSAICDGQNCSTLVDIFIATMKRVDNLANACVTNAKIADAKAVLAKPLGLDNALDMGKAFWTTTFNNPVSWR